MASYFEPTGTPTVTPIDSDLSRREVLMYIGGGLASIVLIGGTSWTIFSHLSREEKIDERQINLANMRGEISNHLNVLDENLNTYNLRTLIDYSCNIFELTFPQYKTDYKKISARYHINSPTDHGNIGANIAAELGYLPLAVPFLNAANEFQVSIGLQPQAKITLA